jgi:penicillin amidase
MRCKLGEDAVRIGRKKLLTALVAVPIAPAAILYATLHSSLPRRAGIAEIPELSAPVEVELDAHAVPRLRASSLADAFRAQGFMHAQERFFAMDLMRRSPAGELAALVGERALRLDRRVRPFEFRTRAAALLERLPAEQRQWLAAYAQGVNAGLADLGAVPPEYLLLRTVPEPWSAEDSVLVVYALYTQLSNDETFEKPQAAMRAVLPPALYAFLTPATSRFDRPLIHPEDDPTGGYAPVEVPPTAAVDLREQPAPHFPRRIVDPPYSGPGSNQWAADASRTASGRAVLANDPHLDLRLPSLFYRCELYWPGFTVRGASVPGLPGILIGASDTLAWGATVSYADQSDWIVVEVDPSDPDRYRVPGGTEPFTTKSLPIAVAGRDAPERVEIRGTRWGPVVDRDGLGRPLVLEATWLGDDGVDLDILDLMRADSVETGLDVVARWAGPSLNWMLADARGTIGWGINGPVPRRVGFDGSVPESRAEGTRRWQGLAELPRLARGNDGVLFTANNRTLPIAAADLLGHAWMRPLRAQRIDEMLGERGTLDESEFLEMQLDTRASAYETMRALILETVPDAERDPQLAWARRIAAGWNGHSDAGETGFLLMQRFYRVLQRRAIEPMLAPVYAADPAFVYRWPLADEVLARLLETRPANLLSADYSSWEDFLRSALRSTVAALAAGPGLDASWGEVNRLEVEHPLAGLPLIGRWLRLPAIEQSGSTVSVRVATASYGAVLRMAVSPADPASGYLELAGGQSGHFLSANFSDLEADWAAGRPTPFLAGPTAARFRLVGASRPAGSPIPDR